MLCATLSSPGATAARLRGFRWTFSLDIDVCQDETGFDARRRVQHLGRLAIGEIVEAFVWGDVIGWRLCLRRSR